MARPWQEDYQRQEREITARHQRSKGVADGGGPPHDSDMEAINARLDAHERRFDRLDEAIRSTKFWVMGTVVAAAISGVAVILTAQSNMLSAFQAGLSAVQGAVAVRGEPPAPPQPIIIQMSAQPQPTPPPEAPRQ